jgi:hypothetical protein
LCIKIFVSCVTGILNFVFNCLLHSFPVFQLGHVTRCSCAHQTSVHVFMSCIYVLGH